MKARPNQKTSMPLFIVGCPRSGTTFFHASLARHPQIISLPETNYFESVLGGFEDWLQTGGIPSATRLLGLARGRAHRRAPGMLRRIAAQLDMPKPSWSLHWSTEGYVKAFTNLMHHAAIRHGRQVWIEKTPAHIAYIDVIRRYVPHARFLHILRRGEDVVTSILEMNLRFHREPEARSFDHALPWWVDYWNRAMETHLLYRGIPSHHFLFYEDLVDNYLGEMRRVSNFIGLPEPAENTDSTVIKVFNPEHGWGPPKVTEVVRASRRADSLLSPFVRDWLQQRLSPYEQVRKQFGLTPKLTPSSGKIPVQQRA